MADLYRRNNRAPCGSRSAVLAAHRACGRIRNEADARTAHLLRIHPSDLRRVAFSRSYGSKEEQEDRYGRSAEGCGIKKGRTI